jgi:hypothetical protein
MRTLAKRMSVMVIVVACSLAATVYTTGIPVSAATTHVPPAYQVLPVQKAGFSIAIPGEWIVFDPTKAESRAQFDALIAANPQMKEFSDAAAGNAEHSVLTALGTGADGTGVVSFGVTFYAGVRALEPASYVKAGLERSGAFDVVKVRRIEVAGEHAIRASCTMPIGTAGPAEESAELTVYELVGPKGVLVVAFASRGGALSAFDRNAVMASLQLGRG